MDIDQPLVVHVIPGLRRAGAETMLLNLLRSADHRLFRHEVVVMGPVAALLDEFVSSGIRVHQINMRRGFPGPRDMLRFIRCLRQLRPRIVQGWMYQANVAVSAAAPFLSANTTIAWNVRRSLDDLNLQSLSLRFAFRMSRMLSGWPAAVIFNSQRGMDQHLRLGFGGGNAIRIPNGFRSSRRDTSQTLWRTKVGVPDDGFVFGMLGRYHPTKNHRLFLTAAASIADAKTFFVMAGEGVDHTNQELTTIINSLGLRDHCLCLGETSEAAELIRACDSVVLPSLSEGFPNVVGEAMSCGVPCIVTDVGDTAELVGDTGLVVPSNNPPLLTAAMEKLRSMTVEQRRELGRAARDRINELYSIKSVTRSYEQLYQRLISDRESELMISLPRVASGDRPVSSPRGMYRAFVPRIVPHHPESHADQFR